MDRGPGGHAFVCYVREDSERVDEIQAELKACGIRVWRDVEALWPGEDWRLKIRRAITDNALVFIACFSRHSIGRGISYQHEELVLAAEQVRLRPPDVPWLVPVRFDDCEIPDLDLGAGRSLRSLQWVDLFGRAQVQNTARLVEGVRQILGCGDVAGGGRGAGRSGFGGEGRDEYLSRLFRETQDRLDDALLMPFAGVRGYLAEATGLMARPSSSSPTAQILSARHFQPAHAPIPVSGIRQAFDLSGELLAVSGGPGSGKTVALLLLAHDLAGEALADPDKSVPVLVSAATWAAGGAAEVGLVPWLARQVPQLAGEMADLVRGQRVVLLVDGLDELPVEGKIEDGQPARYPRGELLKALAVPCRVVLASRPAELDAALGEMAVSKVLELQPLTDTQVTEFTAAVPAAVALLGQDAELRAAARTPLLLSLLCSAADVAGRQHIGHLTAQEARDLLIRSFVESRYQRECDRLVSLQHQVISLDDLYNCLGLLAMRDAGGGGNRNLFAVDEVRSAVADSDARQLVLTAKIMIPADADTLRFFHVSVRDHFAFHYAQQALNDPVPSARDAAAWALWQIPDDRAVDLLIYALSDTYSYARGSAASALGMIGNPRATIPLQRLLTDKTPVASMYGTTIADVAQWALTQIELRPGQHPDNPR